MKRIVVYFCLLTFILSDTFRAAGFAYAGSEVPVSDNKTLSDFRLPPEIGSIQELFVSKTPSPFLIHIQTAHGNYEAEKKVEAILRYLATEYGISLFLFEGAGGVLEPEQDRYFRNPEWNREIMEMRARMAFASGGSLFLLETVQDPRLKPVHAYGVESLPEYRRNFKTFQTLIRGRQPAAALFESYERNLEKIASRKLSKPLRSFLRYEAAFHRNEIPFEAWIGHLRKQSQEKLGLDLGHISSQKEWPSLLRLTRIQEIELKIDRDKMGAEKEAFLKTTTRLLSPKLAEELRALFNHSRDDAFSVSQTYPYGRMRFLLERVVARLPIHFPFEEYPNLILWFQLLVLQNEIRSGTLFQEVERLTSGIQAALAKKGTEKTLTKKFEDLHLLKKLISLELTPLEYDEIMERRAAYPPMKNLRRYCRLALNFYRGARAREAGMVKNVQSRISEHRPRAAVLVTGGFHTAGLQEAFREKGFSYALISPEISEGAGNENYFRSFLSSSHIENGITLPIPLTHLREHGLTHRQFLRPRHEALKEFLRRNPSARSDGSTSLTINPERGPEGSSRRAELRLETSRGTFFTDERLRELIDRHWFWGTEKLRRNAAQAIEDLWIGEAVPVWTTRIPDLMLRYEEIFKRNHQAGLPTTLFVTGLYGTAKSAVSPVLAYYFMTDEELVRRGLKKVLVVQGDRSRYEIAPWDFVVAGRKVGEVIGEITQNYRRYRTAYDQAATSVEKERAEIPLRQTLRRLEDFNSRLEALRLRPYDPDGRPTTNIYRQFDLSEQLRFWNYVRKQPVNGDHEPASLLSFFDLKAGGVWRICLSPEGNLQIVFRLKNGGGHLAAEVTDGLVSTDKIWWGAIGEKGKEENNGTQNSAWKLVVKEGTRYLTADEIEKKTEFFDKKIEVERIERPTAPKGEGRTGFEILMDHTAYRIWIPSHADYFHLSYGLEEGKMSQTRQFQKGEFAPVLLRQDFDPETILIFDWAVPVALKHFDGLFILEADPRVRLARQVSRYRFFRRTGTLSREQFIEHQKRSWHEADPLIREELEMIREEETKTGSPLVWRGTTTSREDITLSRAQIGKLKEAASSPLFRYLRVSDFPNQEDHFENEGATVLWEERINSEGGEFVQGEIKRTGRVLNEFMRIGDSIVLEMGEYVLKGREVRPGVLDQTQPDLQRLDAIRQWGRGLVPGFNLIDFKGRKVKVSRKGTDGGEESYELKLHRILVHEKQVSVGDRLDRWEQLRQEAVLSGQQEAAARYQRQIDRLERGISENEEELKKRSFINRRPERNRTQKAEDPSGKVIHMSFSALDLGNLVKWLSPFSKMYSDFMRRFGIISEAEWNLPVPFLWSFEIDERQRAVQWPLVLKSKIREMNEFLRAVQPGEEDVTGWGKVIRWIHYFKERVAYGNTVAYEVLKFVFGELQAPWSRGLEIDKYKRTVLSTFEEEYPELKDRRDDKELQSSDRVALDHFFDFLPRHFSARAVILDYDGVLYQTRARKNLLTVFHGAFGRNLTFLEFKDIFQELFLRNEKLHHLHQEVLTGEKPFEEFVTRLNELLAERTSINGWVSPRVYQHAIIQGEEVTLGAQEWVADLVKAGIKPVVFSDQFGDIGAEERIMKNLNRDFPGLFSERDLYLSYKIRHRKQEGSPAFGPVLHDLKMSPKDTLFIDNKEWNTKVAEKLGIQTFVYDHRRHGWLADAVIVTPLEWSGPRAELRVTQEIMDGIFLPEFLENVTASVVFVTPLAGKFAEFVHSRRLIKASV